MIKVKKVAVENLNINMGRNPKKNIIALADEIKKDNILLYNMILGTSANVAANVGHGLKNSRKEQLFQQLSYMGFSIWKILKVQMELNELEEAAKLEMKDESKRNS